MRSRRATPVVASLVRVGLLASVLALVASLVVSAAGAAASTIALNRYLGTLPDPGNLTRRDFFQSTKIYDRHGELLYELIEKDGGRRTVIGLNDLSSSVINATLATEDPTFYNAYYNIGFDVRGIARAAWQEYTGEKSSGGSTITQQLARAVLLSPDEAAERSYARKLKEIALAVQITQKYDKDRILEMYFNEIYYGNLSYGISAAAEGYFDKKPKDLTLAESALLAGLPQAPSLYNPIVNPAGAKGRQGDVLRLMVAHGFISQAEADVAWVQPLTYKQPKYDIKAPHFVMYVRDLLEERFGGPRLYRGGYQVYTSLDLRLQEVGERVVKQHIDQAKRYQATNASLVATDPRTGQILAMVGSYDYYDQSIDGQVNVALMERQPGSSIKPVTYSAAFMKGWTPGTTVIDSPLSIKDGDKYWTPMNYDNRFHGSMSVRDALGNSWNIPAVKALQFVGVREMIELARKMGITSFRDVSRYGLAITLGGGDVRLIDHIQVYSVFGTLGEKVPLTPFIKILDENGNVVYDAATDPNRAPERVLTEEIAYMMADVLNDPQARRTTFGTGAPLRLSRPAGVKTGTTDDHRDGWTMGFTPYLAAGVWVGNSNNKPMAGLNGSRTPAPLWHDFMEEAFGYFPRDEFDRVWYQPAVGEKTLVGKLWFDKPARVVDPKTCVKEGMPAGCARQKDLYIEGFEPPAPRFRAEKLLVLKSDNNLRANEGCKPEDVEEKEFYTPLPNAGTLTAEEREMPRPPTKWAPCAIAAFTPTPTPNPASPDAPTSGTPGPVARGPQGVAIYGPGAGSTVRGNVAVSGIANVPNFAAYKVEVSPGLNGGQFTAIGESVTPGDGFLATFSTTQFRNGNYIIYLHVFDRSGGRQTTTIPVVVAN
ncbi:MAG: transglycosylase domain-containing protein [Dehalococcoidia bacterium]